MDVSGTIRAHSPIFALFVALGLALSLLTPDVMATEAATFDAATESASSDRVVSNASKAAGAHPESFELRAQVQALTDLARLEFQGTQRRGLLTPEEFARLERGIASTGLIPLTELSAEDAYKGVAGGGLYGLGRNEPLAAHQRTAREAAAQIRPLDQDGNDSKDGHIVLLSLGMSNTRQHFETFKTLAQRDRDISSRVVVVNGAAGGQDARVWAEPHGDHGRRLSIPPTGELEACVGNPTN